SLGTALRREPNDSGGIARAGAAQTPQAAGRDRQDERGGKRRARGRRHEQGLSPLLAFRSQPNDNSRLAARRERRRLARGEVPVGARADRPRTRTGAANPRQAPGVGARPERILVLRGGLARLVVDDDQ